VHSADFTKYVADAAPFCSCGYSGTCGFICQGGSPTGNPSQCGAHVCSSGEYSFPDSRTWTIKQKTSDMKGKIPYRAFSYVPICNGKSTGTCMPDAWSFAFSFMSEDFEKWTAFVKLFFWTDGHNFIGLLPAGSMFAKSSSMQLIFGPTNDGPNGWAEAIDVNDNQWYNVQFDFTTTTVTMSLDGTVIIDKKAFGLNWKGDANGPQLGIYSFDINGQMSTASTDELKLHLKDITVGCPAGNSLASNNFDGSLPDTPETHTVSTVKPGVGTGVLRVKEGSCELAGCTKVTTENGCATTSQQLAASDTSPYKEESEEYPSGCYLEGGMLWFNAKDTKVPCSDSMLCLCSGCTGGAAPATANCASSGAECTSEKCCSEVNEACYEKHTGYAQCMSSCRAGSYQFVDSEQCRSAWTCNQYDFTGGAGQRANLSWILSILAVAVAAVHVAFS